MKKSFIERNKIETEMAGQAEQYATLKRTTTDGFLLIDSTGHILDWNGTISKLLGYSGEELASMSVADFEASESPEEIQAHIGKIIAAGSDIFDTKHRAKDGSILDVEISISFCSRKNLFMVFIRDITERLRELEELRKLREESEKVVIKRTEELRIALEATEAANKSRADFLSRMSHELRTPLNAIIGFSQLLKTDKNIQLSTEKKENIDEILKAGRHLLTLIETMLEFSAISNNILDMKIVPADMSELAAECIDDVQSEAEQLGISIHPSLESACVARIDRERFRQSLLCLLKNAVKYNRSGGEIFVTSSCAEGKTRVEVRDTGRGISTENLKRIFEPFERVDSLNEGRSGIGIGLAMAKQLVEEMQGTIGVESTPDSGSTFWIEMSST